MVAYRRRMRGFHLDKHAEDLLRADAGKADAMLTETELAAVLNVSVGWVRYVRNYRGDGPPCVDDDEIRYRRRDVRSWLEERRKYYAEKIEAKQKFDEKQKLERIAFKEAAARKCVQASKRAGGGRKTRREERKEKTAQL
jgi:hypothetical protein